MINTFEAHITIDPKYASLIDSRVDTEGWKTSYIVGDEELGDAKFFYLTSNHVDAKVLREDMEDMIECLNEGGVPILRKKLEFIFLDERY